MQLLERTAKKFLGLQLDPEQLERFQLYYKTLSSHNEKVNLTAIVEYEAVQVRHFLDSLTLASPVLRGDSPGQFFDLEGASLIDVGTGAGFPGLPLKILYPSIRLTLVESVAKKTAFLREVSAALGFPEVEVLTIRVEEIGQSPLHREHYDLATARAVASLAVLAEYCLPLVRPGGIFIAPKKEAAQAEIEEARKAVEILGGSLRPTPPFALPAENGNPGLEGNDRRLVVVDKIKSTPTAYPRRVGAALKKPLRP